MGCSSSTIKSPSKTRVQACAHPTIQKETHLKTVVKRSKLAVTQRGATINDLKPQSLQVQNLRQVKPRHKSVKEAHDSLQVLKGVKSYRQPKTELLLKTDADQADFPNLCKNKTHHQDRTDRVSVFPVGDSLDLVPVVEQNHLACPKSEFDQQSRLSSIDYSQNKVTLRSSTSITD